MKKSWFDFITLSICVSKVSALLIEVLDLLWNTSKENPYIREMHYLVMEGVNLRQFLIKQEKALNYGKEDCLSAIIL
jgi:hypothetical protein